MVNSSVLKVTTLFLLLLIINYLSYSLDIDSLNAEIEKINNKATKAELLIELLNSVDSIDLEESFLLARRALKYATESNQPPEVGLACNKIGNYLLHKEQADTAIVYLNKALSILTDIKDKGNVSKTYFYLGVAYEKKDSIKKSKTNYLTAIQNGKEAELLEDVNYYLLTLGDLYFKECEYDSSIIIHKEILTYDSILSGSVSQQALKTLNDIGILYYYKGDFLSSLEYFLAALGVAEQLDLESDISTIYNNIGLVYYEQKSYDKAIEILQKAADMKEKLNEKPILAVITCNLALCEIEKQRIPEAYRLLHKAEELSKEVGGSEKLSKLYRYMGRIEFDRGNFSISKNLYTKGLEIAYQVDLNNSIIECYEYLGKIEIALGNFNKGLDLLNKGLELSKNVGMLELEKDVEKDLAQVFKNMKDYEKAVEHLNKYNTLNDSLFKIENRRLIYNLGAKYENDRKELEIQMALKDKQLKEIEIKRQKAIRNVIVLFVFMVLVAILLIFNNGIKQLKAKM